ncbi:MAG: RAMP superfamily CRISPR-associated protein [Syntrophobacteraceae bacterium]|jgi:CRISPR-associated RAMP protein (TIGR02581 family)
MLKKIVNHAQIELKIIPIDPILIKSGQATVGGTNMSFVRTYRFGEKAKFYIPGSSIKGVFRSYSEKICRSLRDDSQSVPVCLPYLDPGREPSTGERGQASCGLQFDSLRKVNVPSQEVYRCSCPTCRLFGSHGFVGRFAASDAYPVDGVTMVEEIRDGVAIDRLTGGAAPGAKYDLEVLARGELTTTLEIRNFERWQLGLVSLVLRDMEDGLVRIGYGKSRGLGRIKAVISLFRITYYGRRVATLVGLGSNCSQETCSAYGFFPETNAVSPSLPEPVTKGLRHEYNVTKNWKDVAQPAVDDLVSYIQGVDWPQILQSYLRNIKGRK